MEEYFLPKIRREVERFGLVNKLTQNLNIVKSASNKVVKKASFDGFELYTLDVNGKPAGGIYTRPQAKGWNHIAALWVGKEYRGLGLGSFLTRAYLGDNKNKQITLETQSNNDGANILYKKVGFELFQGELLKKYEKSKLKPQLRLLGKIKLFLKRSNYNQPENVVYGIKPDNKEYLFAHKNYPALTNMSKLIYKCLRLSVRSLESKSDRWTVTGPK